MNHIAGRRHQARLERIGFVYGLDKWELPEEVFDGLLMSSEVEFLLRIRMETLKCRFCGIILDPRDLSRHLHGQKEAERVLMLRETDDRKVRDLPIENCRDQIENTKFVSCFEKEKEPWCRLCAVNVDEKNLENHVEGRKHKKGLKAVTHAYRLKRDSLPEDMFFGKIPLSKLSSFLKEHQLSLEGSK